MNEFHGNASILKRYADLPLEAPLPFALEHAIPYDLAIPYEYDRDCGLPFFLAVHDRSTAIYRSAGFQQVEPIGFSYLYALKLFQRLHADQPVPERRGTLVFPDKSTLLMDTDFDRESFARHLAALPELYQPVVVCLYWKDVLRNNHLPFRQAGLPVVSAGHTRDPNFLLRLHDLCRRFRFSCANDLAGSFALSVLSGCHFFHLPTGPLTIRKYGQTHRLDQDPTLLQPEKEACLKVASFPPTDRQPQQQLAEYHTGRKYQKSPRQLRALYHQARRQLGSNLIPRTIVPEKTEERARFFSLLPTGFDWDGWARSKSGLCLARGHKISAIRLHLYLGNKEMTYTSCLRVYRNRRLVRTLQAPPFYHYVKLSCRPGWKDLHLDFEAEGHIQLPGEKRQRSFWIQAIELIYQSRWKKIFFNT
jgi:hypothetical protein